MNAYLPPKKKYPGLKFLIPVIAIVCIVIWFFRESTDTISDLMPEQQAATQADRNSQTRETAGSHNKETLNGTEPGAESLPLQASPPDLKKSPRPGTELVIEKNSSVYETLRTAGFTPADIHQVVTSAKSVFDLAKIRSGVRVLIYGHTAGQAASHDKSLAQSKPARRIEFLLSVTDTLSVSSEGNGWTSEIHSKPVTTKTLGFQGEVTSSLWLSATEAGLDSVPIYALTDILAWQIDFDREVQPGDHWRLLVERTYVDEKPVGWGAIVIAEYQRGGETYRAIRYPAKGDKAEYYSPEGDNMKGRFLKSPLRYSRISSGFQLKRFHPVLGVNRPHYGVDYAAPHGTPVRAVGDGKISVIGRRGGNGKMIRIRHNSAYETAYKHLSRYGKGLKKGSKVKQGDVIAYVGSTGLATGPHLHFEFYENGKFTDPLGRKFPREDPVPATNRKDFLRHASEYQDMLNQQQPVRPKIAGSESHEKEEG